MLCSCCLTLGAIFVAAILYHVIRRKLDSRYLDDVTAKYVLITGCDTGFGYEAAKRLDELGCHVIAGCLTDEGCARLRTEASSRLRALPLDVTSDVSVTQLANQIAEIIPKGQGLWGLVNNAGAMGAIGPLEWLSGQHVLEVMNLNVAGVMRVTNACLPLLRISKGRIVNTASVLGYISMPFLAPYCASKHAVVAISNSLRRELSCFGISVHMVEPGGHRTAFMATKMIKSKGLDAYNALPPALKRLYGEKYLQKMLYVATDVAKAVAEPRPTKVVDAYCSALLSQYPRMHYVVGRDSWLYMGLYYLPDYFMDLFSQIPTIQPRPALQRESGGSEEG